MNENGKFVLIEKNLVAQVIGGLKRLDVRGYESMENVVSMVNLFTGLYNSPGLNMEMQKSGESAAELKSSAGDVK